MRSYSVGSVIIWASAEESSVEEIEQLGKLGFEAYSFLNRKLGIKPHFELVVLDQEDWKKAFGSQPYGDPVTPDDGCVYYGREVPQSWKKDAECLRAASHLPNSSFLTLAFFYRTIAHEIGHLFSNELMGSDLRKRFDDDFHRGNLEILWFIETFSQCCQLAFLDERNDPLRLKWLGFYNAVFEVFGKRVKNHQFGDWGTKLLSSMQTDIEDARMNYVWMQAKSYLMCDELIRKTGAMSIFRDFSDMLRRMEYKITSTEILQNISSQLPEFRDVFDRWNDSVC